MAKHSPIVSEVAAVQAHAFSGPLPRPQDFAEYDHTLSGAAERILALTERESAFRHESELKRLEIAEKDAHAAREETKRGQFLSFAITCVAFASAVACAIIGQPWVAGIIAGTTLVSVVSAIMRQKK